MTDLYRFYDADDRLLYVGISLHAAQRASEHRREKQWWPDVARMDVQHLEGDRKHAEAVERQAIIEEAPVYNVVHARRTMSPALQWVCEVCETPIGDNDGYLELPHQEARRYKRSMERHRQRYPKPDLTTLTPAEQLRASLIDWNELADEPDRAHWWAIHRSCDPNLEGSGYWIGIERIRDPFQVIQWTAHLLEKNWFDETDWDDLLSAIRSDAPVSTRRRPALRELLI